MKKLFRILPLLTLAWSSPAFAQDQTNEYQTYDWEANPKLTITDQDTSNNSVIVFNRYYYEYIYEDNSLYEYMIAHKRVKLITHVGIEEENKIYIPLGDDDKVVSQKARVIKNDGSVRELKKDEFKEAYDEETGKKYQYFAFEGIEIGCEIEYLYCIKQLSSLSGSISTIQSGLPVLSFDTKYTLPSNLFFKFRSFNGCPEAVYDTTEKDKNVWTIKLENIPPLKDEESSALKAEYMKYAMKLDRNTYNGKKDIYSYGPVASDIYDRIFNKPEPKDAKIISGIIKEIKPDAETDEGKIRQVENYIKTNYIYDDEVGADKTSISVIQANKVFGDFGSVKLYGNIFKNMGIETEIVLTCDRFENKFDKSFECYAFLHKYLLYFPKIKKYLEPGDNFSRLGFPSNEYINNYGLFIKSVSMGDYSTGLGKIKFIEGAKYSESLDKITVNADIPDDFNEPKFEIIREISGYCASFFQPFFDFIQEEDKLKDFSEELIKYIDNEGTIENLTLENNNGNSFAQKPLIAKAVLKSDHFFEKAGDKYLFKVGLLIGPQMELYKKEERKLPLEFLYNHGYLRVITFKIPDGYVISNLEQLKMNETYIRNNNDTTMAFVSDYKKLDNKVIITINEYYKEYSYTTAEFEEYRRVANAAANFNKVVLVFEKK